MAAGVESILAELNAAVRFQVYQDAGVFVIHEGHPRHDIVAIHDPPKCDVIQRVECVCKARRPHPGRPKGHDVYVHAVREDRVPCEPPSEDCSQRAAQRVSCDPELMVEVRCALSEELRKACLQLEGHAALVVRGVESLVDVGTTRAVPVVCTHFEYVEVGVHVRQRRRPAEAHEHASHRPVDNDGRVCVNLAAQFLDGVNEVDLLRQGRVVDLRQ